VTETDEPAASLAALEVANDRLAKRMKWPVWRHMAGGLLLTLIVAAVALPVAAAWIVFFAAILLTVVIVRSDKKRHGMFVSGFQRGRTGWVIAATVALLLGALKVVSTQWAGNWSDPLLWLTLAVVFAGTTTLSLLWEQVYRADIRKSLR
jgi:hypothetical protein